MIFLCYSISVLILLKKVSKTEIFLNNLYFFKTLKSAKTVEFCMINYVEKREKIYYYKKGFDKYFI